MKTLAYLALCGLVLAVAGTAGAAGIVNGSFENGLTGWTTQTSQGGSVAVVSNFESWNPTDGSKFALLTTGDPQLFGSENWQLLFQTPTLDKGCQVSFDYFFDNDALIGNDIARIKLGGVVVAQITADTPGECTGSWVHYVSAPLASAGAYTIEFGVQDNGCIIDICDSHMGVDNVAATCPVVPEPVTMLGVFAGISGIGAYIRKRA